MEWFVDAYHSTHEESEVKSIFCQRAAGGGRRMWHTVALHERALQHVQPLFV